MTQFRDKLSFKRFRQKQVSLNKKKRPNKCLLQQIVCIYDRRAVIKALIYAAAGEQKEKQEEGKLQDTVWGLV